MADFNKPATSDTYANVLAYINAKFSDLALGMDPATTTPTNTPTNAIRWNSANNRFEKYNGTAWAVLSSSYDFGSITLSGGTANGVPYLNASKVLTSGSAIVFDGANLGIGTASPQNRMHVVAPNGAYTARFGNAASGAQLFTNFVVNESGTPLGVGQFQTDGTGFTVAATSYLLFNTSGSEKARLDSSGNLGLGVVPSAWISSRRALQIGGSTVSALALGAGLSEIITNAYVDSGGVGRYLTSNYVGSITFNNNVTGGWAWMLAPSGTAGAAITFTQAMALSSTGLSVTGALSATGGYLVSGPATLSASLVGVLSYEAPITRYYIGDGTGYSWAFSKRVTSTTTDLLTLNDAGNLGLGVTPSAWSTAYKVIEGQYASGFYIGNSGNSGMYGNAYKDAGGWKYKTGAASGLYEISQNNHSWFIAPVGTAGNPITWTQAMTLNASGQLQVTSSSGATGIFNSTSAGGAYISIQSNGTNIAYMGNAAALIGGGSASDMAFTTPAANNMLFAIANVEKVRISSSGGLSVGTTTDAGAGNILASGTVSDGTGTLRPLVQSTAQATTSGSTRDFTVPSWAKRITVMVQGVSPTGVGILAVQLGTSGGMVGTGYLGGLSSGNNAIVTSSHSGSFAIAQLNSGASIFNGEVTLNNLTGNNWTMHGIIQNSDTTTYHFSAGSNALAAALTTVRILVSGGSNFDAGQVNVLFE